MSGNVVCVEVCVSVKVVTMCVWVCCIHEPVSICHLDQGVLGPSSRHFKPRRRRTGKSSRWGSFVYPSEPS